MLITLIGSEAQPPVARGLVKDSILLHQILDQPGLLAMHEACDGLSQGA
ncbi:MAG: hypothetical protein AAFY15_10785 [Cyanobacteria bacterium J06648_11]